MYKGTLNTEKFYIGLQKEAAFSKEKLRTRHPDVVKFFLDHGITPGGIRKHAVRVAGAAAIAGAMLFAPPITAHVMSTPAVQQASTPLSALIPTQVGPLTPQQEDALSQKFYDVWGITAVGTLDGNHLNTTYGLIGAEQHLPRFPDDSVDNMAPGTGAWGYFAPSQGQMTDDLYAKEQWYVAVQTLYLPDWNTNTAALSKWYKYRKVLVVNTQNGNAVVADVADAGPADWTGKQFGGSPEVMEALSLNTGIQKGPVVLFFVNDPKNIIPLGPLKPKQYHE